MSDSAQSLTIIEGFATGTPNHVLRQSEAAKFLTSLDCLERNQNRIEKIYENTRIDTRYLAINLLAEETIAFSQKRNTLEARMQMYEKYAFSLADEVARKALLAASNPAVGMKIVDQIGLIVFVTSTGFVAPGIDTKLIESLGLRRNIARIPVNFMGCAAAMTGLRVCCDHVRANPQSKALMVCLELSSVNAVFNDDLNDIIIHSLFGDGCAAAVIGASTNTSSDRGKFAIKDNFSHLVKNTEDGITLGVKDNGITCLLSRHLPDYIEDGVGTIVKDFLATHDLTKSDIDLWAVHPGGRKIIEKVQLSLGLDDEQVSDSWEILREYGNMLSCSILFVMERMMLKLNESSARSAQEARSGHESIEHPRPINGIAFSFSPGVGVEGILFEKV